MSKKIYDICAKTGSYTDREGQTKNRYQNVGAVIQGQDGPFIIMERWFNPAGVPTDRDNTLLSLFRADRERPQQNEQQRGGYGGGQGGGGLDDEIPFARVPGIV